MLLARSMSKQEALKPFFFDSRYQIALCRSRQAMLEQDPERQKKLYEQALADVRSTYINYPDLGGESMAKQFDDLTRSVQAALKQEVKASRPSRNDHYDRSATIQYYNFMRV